MPVTTQDIDMALEVIARNTLRVPGMTPGSRISIGPGPFSASDAVVLLALKSASRDRRLLPEAAFTSALKTVTDSDLNKGIAHAFWREFALESGGSLKQPVGFHFENYILKKSATKTKRGNARLQGFVAADQQWRKVMNSEQKRQDRIATRGAEAQDAREKERESNEAEWNRSVLEYTNWAMSLVRDRAPTQ